MENNYLILANDKNSPLYQLELSLRIIIANKRKIEWKITEEILKNLKEIIPNKKILWGLEDGMFEDFENIKYTDIILKDYVDLVKDYFCKNK